MWSEGEFYCRRKKEQRNCTLRREGYLMKVTVKKRNGGEGVEGGQVIRETLKKCFGKVLDCGKKVRL